MKKIIIVILILVVGAFVIHSMAGDYITAKFAEKIKANYNLDTRIEQINLSFIPLGLSAHGINLFRSLDNQPEDFLKTRSLSLSPSAIALFTRRIILNNLKLTEPDLTVVRYNRNSFNLTEFIDYKKKLPQKSPPDKKSFLAMSLVVENGKAHFIDRYTRPAVKNIELTDIDIKVKKVSIPVASLDTNFDISFTVLGESGRGGVEFSGWVEPVKKDIDAKLKVVHLDLAPLAPYCTKFVTCGIESGILYLNSDIKAKDNILNAQCHLEIHDLKFKPRTNGGGTFFGMPAEEVINLIRSNSGALVLDFEIKGKLDSPQVDKQQIINEVLNRAMQNLLQNNLNKLLDDLIGAGEFSKEKAEDAKEGVEDIGDILKGTLEEIFK